MNESEIIKLVRQVVRQEITPVMMGFLRSHQSQTKVSAQRFSTEGQINSLRNLSPYGLSSRAPANTPCMIAPVNSDPTHLNVVSYFDESRPTTGDGETILYNSSGQAVYLANGSIKVGSKTSANPMLLGDIVQQFLKDFLDAIINHTHTSATPGNPTTPPINAAAFSALKASPVSDGNILSDTVFTEK